MENFTNYSLTNHSHIFTERYSNTVYRSLVSYVYNLFDATARGIQYWRKHKQHRCYVCNKKGHIAQDCENICILCGNLHNGTVCVFSLTNYMKHIVTLLKDNKFRDTENIARRIQRTQAKIMRENAESKWKQQAEIYKTQLTFAKQFERITISSIQMSTVHTALEIPPAVKCSEKPAPVFKHEQQLTLNAARPKIDYYYEAVKQNYGPEVANVWLKCDTDKKQRIFRARIMGYDAERQCQWDEEQKQKQKWKISNLFKKKKEIHDREVPRPVSTAVMYSNMKPKSRGTWEIRTNHKTYIMTEKCSHSEKSIVTTNYAEYNWNKNSKIFFDSLVIKGTVYGIQYIAKKQWKKTKKNKTPMGVVTLRTDNLYKLERKIIKRYTKQEGLKLKKKYKLSRIPKYRFDKGKLVRQTDNERSGVQIYAGLNTQLIQKLRDEILAQHKLEKQLSRQRTTLQRAIQLEEHKIKLTKDTITIENKKIKYIEQIRDIKQNKYDIIGHYKELAHNSLNRKIAYLKQLRQGIRQQQWDINEREANLCDREYEFNERKNNMYDDFYEQKEQFNAKKNRFYRDVEDMMPKDNANGMKNKSKNRNGK